MQIEPTWDDLRVLLALHRHKSFLGAGRALGVSTSTAARRIEALEATLGRPLVHRSSGGTSLVPDALELVALAEQMELGLRALRRDEGAARFAGTVRISVGEGAIEGITETIAALRRAHPELFFELLSETRLVDLAKREADIGLRAMRSRESAVVHRLIGRGSFALYAAPSYLERRLRSGRLTTAELVHHDFIGDERWLGETPKSSWLAAHGAKRFVIRSNSDVAILAAARLGQGIVMLPTLGASRSGLVRLAIDAELPTTPAYLAYHRDLRSVPRVKLVLDALTEAFQRALH